MTFIVCRLIGTIPVLLLVTLMVFSLTHMAPGAPLRQRRAAPVGEEI